MTFPATLASTEMAQLYGNAGGAVQSLPAVTVLGGKQRLQRASIALASQASGAVIHIARLPIGAMLTGIVFMTDTSLGSATISVGDFNAAAIYAAAQTLTSTNSKVSAGLVTTMYKIITTGYDAVLGGPLGYALPGQGGANYEDLVMVVGTAALPSSGNLVVAIEYIID